MAKTARNRDEIASYVHDVAEMEKQIFILNSTKDELARRAEEMRHAAQKRLQDVETKISTSDENLRFGKSVGKNLKSKRLFDFNALIKTFEESAKDIIRFIRFLFLEILELFEFSSFGKIYTIRDTFIVVVLDFILITCLGGFIKIILLLCYVFLITLIFLILPVLALEAADGIGGFGAFLCPWLICFAVALVRRIIIEKAERKRLLALNGALCIAGARELEELKQEKACAVRDNIICQNRAKLLLLQAKICGDAADKIYSMLNKIYISADIIKEGYRYIDCVVILDFAFKNDLVDTIREGIEYYETRVFRNRVIKGIQNICSRIDELTSTVRAIGRDILDIRDRIDGLNSNAEEIITGLTRTEALQNKALAIHNEALNNTKATRYAVESIRDSTRRYNYMLF